MRKLIGAVVTAIVLLCSLFPSAAIAAPLPEVECETALLIDAKTGGALFGKNALRDRYPASTTKIMTAVLCLEKGNLDEQVTVGTEVRGFSAENSLMGLREGESLKLLDLLYGTMLVSGNDAAASVAVHVGGTMEEFIAMMNDKAAELGMTRTHYVNPHGLHNENHYTTAEDMAKLARYAYQNATFRTIVSTRTYQVAATNRHSNGFTLTNTNRLISDDPAKQEDTYEYATGMKTGNTNAAKGCLVASAEKDGKALIAVLLSDPTDDLTARWKDAAALFDYGFSVVKTISAQELSAVLSPLSLVAANAYARDAQGGVFELVPKLDGIVFSGVDTMMDAILREPSSLQTSYDVTQPVKAPIQEGETYGRLTCSYNDQLLFSAPLTASRTVQSGPEETASPDSDTPAGTAQDIDPFVSSEQPVTGGPSTLFWVLLLALLLLILAGFYFVTRRKHHRKPNKKYYVYKDR